MFAYTKIHDKGKAKFSVFKFDREDLKELRAADEIEYYVNAKQTYISRNEILDNKQHRHSITGSEMFNMFEDPNKLVKKIVKEIFKYGAEGKI